MGMKRLYSSSFITENRQILWLLILFCMLTCTLPQVHAQDEDLFGSTEDDSLLFGDEFDLGGDEFSFEIEEGGDADTETGGEEDFFGDFGEEEEEADQTDSAEVSEEDEWGLGASNDYESLITRTTGGNPLGDTPSHPLDFKPRVKGTFFEGMGFTLSLYSPQVVPEVLNTWYSFLDFSFTTELPWHVEMDPLALAFLVDISSFNFENSFPVGGEFKGVSIMPMARIEVSGVEAEVGLGTFLPSFGAVAGIGYSYQFYSLFVSAGYRWNWAYNIEPIGSAWWLEPRMTVGLKFW